MNPGFRCCVLLSRHSSVASSVPRPFTSMLPPSSTTRRPLCTGLPDAMFQPAVGFLHRQRVFPVIGVFCPAVEGEMVVSDVSFAASHTDGTGIAHPTTIGRHAKKFHRRKIRTRFFQNGAHACFGGTIFNQEKNPFDRDNKRTISANAQGMVGNFPGQSVTSCGQPSQVPSWGSHSAGMRYSRSAGVGDSGWRALRHYSASQRFRIGG